MQRRLITQLVLPLIAATALAVLVHRYWAADGFFINLAAGFVGSLVTVFYVDWILERHERDRWREADSRIARRLRRLVADTVTGIRTSFGFGTNIFDDGALSFDQEDSMHSEVVRVATHVLAPAAEARVRSLTTAGWKDLASHLHAAALECGVLLDRFGHRLHPKTIATLLDLQQALEASQTFWHIFPDIAGVPKSQLPATVTPPEQLQAAGCASTAKELRRALDLATRLLANHG